MAAILILCHVTIENDYIPHMLVHYMYIFHV